jgi:SpoVK/Ycf46/Vps4 family AAA+-type ATPase
MSRNTAIIRAFRSLWDITFAESSSINRDNPIVFTVDNEQLDQAPLQFRAWVYNRYNNVSVLRIDVNTKTIEMADVHDIERWAIRENGRLPFASIRVNTDAQRNLSMTVTHSLLASEVTAAQLKEAVDSMCYVWKKCNEKLDDSEPLGEEWDDFLDDPAGLGEVSLSENHDTSQDTFVDEANTRVISPDKEDSVDLILAELNALIGLEPVKALVRQLAAQQQVAQQRRNRGMNAIVPSPHLVFLGNPGTGKTTVARLIGRLYKAFGLVTEGHVVEADRSSLVAGYIGQTAIKTREMCTKALGGVLFIDEAYGLHVDGRDYGTEAIETLLTFMEAHRGQFAVVVAGYPEKMMEFLQSNPGLKSRFDMSILFPDYSTAELTKIFEDLVAAHDYVLHADASEKVRDYIDSWNRGEGFGNAREVRRFFQHVVGIQAMALVGQSMMDTMMLREITADMIPDAELSSTEVINSCPGYSFRNGYL